MRAHSSNLEHPIFKGPFKVNIKTETIPTPEAASHYSTLYTEPMPKTLEAWQVEKPDYHNDIEHRFGLIARPAGYLDSPETEVISGGESSKAYNAVAIGTHANFFFWGYAASPEWLTEEGKTVFANAVAYTATLKGKRMIARRYDDRANLRVSGLKSLIEYGSRSAYEEKNKSAEQQYQSQLATQKQARELKAKGQKINPYQQHLINTKIVNKAQTWEEFAKEKMGVYYDKFKGDTDKYYKYLSDNTDYIFVLRTDNKTFIVDEDAKKLKTANNDPAILDKAISLLEKGKDVDMAKRILDRYTLCTFTEVSEWREWYNTNKDKLFFSESGGWYFMVNSMDYGVEANDYRAKQIYSACNLMPLGETTEREPVAMSAKLINFEGGDQAVIIRMNIKDGFHIYSSVAEGESYITTTFDLSLPEGVTLGEMMYPMDSPYTEGVNIYEGELVFVQYLVGRAKEGTVKLRYEYQCCDEQSCLPPFSGEKAL